MRKIKEKRFLKNREVYRDGNPSNELDPWEVFGKGNSSNEISSREEKLTVDDIIDLVKDYYPNAKVLNRGAVMHKSTKIIVHFAFYTLEVVVDNDTVTYEITIRDSANQAVSAFSGEAYVSEFAEDFADATQELIGFGCKFQESKKS